MILLLNNRENSQPDPTTLFSFFFLKKLTRNQSTSKYVRILQSSLKARAKLCSLKAKNDSSLSLLHVVLLDCDINRA